MNENPRVANRGYGKTVLADLGRELRTHYEPDIDNAIPPSLTELLKRLHSREILP